MIFHILQPKTEGYSMIMFYDCFNFKLQLIDISVLHHQNLHKKLKLL
jgi:hypothetical protein